MISIRTEKKIEEKPQNHTTLQLLVKRIRAGSLVILFIGVCSFAILFIAMCLL